MKKMCKLMALVMALMLAAMGCAVFLLLDLALGRLTVLWRRKLRRRFFRK